MNYRTKRAFLVILSPLVFCRCHNTEMIAAASGDDSVSIFQEDLSAGDRAEPVFNLICRVRHAHEQDVNAVTWNPSVAGLLATCSDDGTIKIWKMTGE